MINDLYGLYDQKSDHDAIHDILSRMIEYALSHFRTEEAYFERFNYPDRRHHEREHSAFSKKVLEFNKKFDDNESELTEVMLDFLIDWLVNHILHSDKAYMKHLNQNGVF